MGVLSILLHVFNLIAPALGMALVLPLLMRFWQHRARVSLAKQMLLHALLGSVCLVVGLWLWGTDGRMATYGLLTLVLGSAQFWFARR